MADIAEDERFIGETSAKQVFHRMAGTWTYWGWKGGYFDAEEDARAYYDEMRYMLARQVAAPNSPQWFHTGLPWAYGIDGPSQGHHYVDFSTGERSEERRVGKECVSTGRTRWLQDHSKQQHTSSPTTSTSNDRHQK